jgi:hypothetical protein
MIGISSRREMNAEMAADDLRDKLVQILRDSRTREDTICACRTLLTKALRDGEEREAIVTELQGLLKLVSSEQEDILLEILDFLVGWCSPHAKL